MAQFLNEIKKEAERVLKGEESDNPKCNQGSFHSELLPTYPATLTNVKKKCKLPDTLDRKDFHLVYTSDLFSSVRQKTVPRIQWCPTAAKLQPEYNVVKNPLEDDICISPLIFLCALLHMTV